MHFFWILSFCVTMLLYITISILEKVHSDMVKLNINDEKRRVANVTYYAYLLFMALVPVVGFFTFLEFVAIVSDVWHNGL